MPLVLGERLTGTVNCARKCKHEEKNMYAYVINGRV
jgi:hypothetical protein